MGVHGLFVGLALRRDAFFPDCIRLLVQGRTVETNVPRDQFSGLLGRSWPFYLESYINYFRSHGDTWFISQLLGLSGLATYYIAKRFFDLAISVFSSLDRVATRSISARRFDKKNLRHMSRT